MDNNTIKFRVCKTCGAEHPETKEFFAAKDKKGRLDTNCKACRSKIKLDWYERNRQHIHEYSVKYHQENRDKNNTRTRNWLEHNRDRKKEGDKKNYRQNREKRIVYSVQWKRLNKSRVSGYHQTYKSRYPEKVRATSARWHIRIRQAEGRFTGDDLKAIYAAQDGKCKWCGVELNGVYHIDHIMPLVLGGSNWPENLCCSCPTCNTSKGGKHPDEWLRKLSRS